MKPARVLCATAAVAIPLALALPAAGAGRATPHVIAPVTTAWFDQARPTAVVPAAPELPPVGPHDLLVEGITVQTGQLPIPLPTQLKGIRIITAFAALRFTLPAGATPASLTLRLTGLTTAKVDALLPSGVAPIACPIRKNFAAGGQQPWDTAPAYDCDRRTSTGHLSQDHTSVVFSDIGGLATGRRLAFAILPGSLGLERLQFAAPGPRSLGLLRFGGGVAPTDVPTVSPTPSVAPSDPPATPATTGRQPALPRLQAVPTPPMPGQTSPQVAPTSRPAIAGRAAADPIDDTRARAAALAGLAALLVAAAWLGSTDGRGRALPRLRLRVTTPGTTAPGEPKPDWGVGRFRAPRDGPPPTI